MKLKGILKRLAMLTIMAVLMLCLLPMGANAAYILQEDGNPLAINSVLLSDSGDDQGVKYRITKMPDGSNPGEVVVCGNNGSVGLNGAVVISSAISIQDQMYTVTGIDASAFENCPNLTSISYPTEITVGNRAFKGTSVKCAVHRFNNSACQVCDYTCTHTESANCTRGEDGKCTVCKTDLVASLSGNPTTYYATADQAFTAAKTAGSGTVTILADTEITNRLYLYTDEDADISLAVDENVTLTMTGNSCLYMSGSISGGGKIAATEVMPYLVVYPSGSISNVEIACRAACQGTIYSGTFTYQTSAFLNSGTIKGGTFNCDVEHDGGTIEGGTFNGAVTNEYDGVISGGTFNASLVNEYDERIWSTGTINADNLTLGENFSFTEESGSYKGISCTTHQRYAAATCVTPATCIFCGHTEGEADANAHNLSYEVAENVITETCAHNCAAPATAALDINTGSVTYNGTAQTIETYVSYSKTWRSGELTVQYENNTNVGTATVYIQTGEAKATRTFFITKATPAAEYFTFTPPESLIYNGSEKTAAVEVKSGYTGMGEITIVYYEGETKLDGAPTDAGTYTVKITVADGDNFNASTGEITDPAWTFTVAQAESVATVPTPINNLIYKGEMQNLFNAGTTNGNQVFEYSLDQMDWVDTILQATNAGTYDVYWRAGSDNGNYKLTCGVIPVTIAPATITVRPDDQTVTYGDPMPALSFDSTGHVGTEIPAFDGALAVDGMDAGTYEIKLGTLKLADNGNFKADNYELKLVPVNLTVKQAANSWITEPNVTNWGYGMEPNIPTADPKFGALITEYRLQSGTDADYTAQIPTVPHAYFVRFRVEEATNWTALAQVEKLNISRAPLTVRVKDQTIRFGQQIDRTAYTVEGLVAGDAATVNLTASTDKVTKTGLIEAEIVIRNAAGTDVSDYYDIGRNDGKLVIEPDISKIGELTEKNVTAANEEDIETVLAQIAAGDAAAQEAWKAVSEDCRKLLEKIEAVQKEQKAIAEAASQLDETTVNSTDKEDLEQLAEDIEALLDTDNLTENERKALENLLGQVNGMINTVEDTAENYKAATDAIDALDPATVTSDDKDELEQAIETIGELLKDDHLTEDERKALEGAKADAETLIGKIDAAHDAVNTENTEKVENVTSENAKPEDKEALKDAKADLEKALEDNADNYTGEEKKAIQKELAQINAALTTLENAEGVTGSIKQLPESVEPDDEAAAEKILAAMEDYDALTDYEKSLVDETAKKKLDELVIALTAYDIVKGDGGKWTNGSDGRLSFTANGPFSKFVGIEVDGKEVNEKYYSAKSGSTIITLKQTYLKKLSTGEHTITVLYKDGETSATFKIQPEATNPATGDDSNIMLHGFVFAVSLAGIVVLFLVEKKRRMENA